MVWYTMNLEHKKELYSRGFINTTGNHFYKIVGMYTLRVWLHTNGGEAEVVSRLSRESQLFGGARVARLDYWDTLPELDKFFAPYQRVSQ